MFHEDDVHDPRNVYALTMSLFDQYVEPFLNYDSQIVGLRYFNVYGKNEDHKQGMASPVHKFINQAKLIKKIEEHLKIVQLHLKKIEQ